MSAVHGDPLAMIRDLGAPDGLRKSASAPRAALRANAHVHLPPNFSAFESVAEVVALAAGESLDLLGASNYYDFTAYRAFAAQAAMHGIFPLYGIEVIAMVDDLRGAGVRVNDPNNPGRMYLCGKGLSRFAQPAKVARTILGNIRRSDEERMRRMITLLADVFASRGAAVNLDYDAVVDRIVRRHDVPRETVTPQERHVALSFQQALFESVPDDRRGESLARVLGAPAVAAQPIPVQNEIRSRLLKAGRPAYVDERFVTFDDACRLILALGGIPSYPTLADGAKPICEFEAPVEALIDNLRSRGIHAAEFIPTRNRPEVLTQYVPAMRQAGLVITAGTEHNTLDRIALTPAALNGAPIPESVAAVFREGACVAAAHQYLAARGECGYVDGEGRLNPAYPSQTERIADLAALGAGVIAAFQSRHEEKH